jgi:Outer membrane lipoprotein-sorting protein
MRRLALPLLLVANVLFAGPVLADDANPSADELAKNALAHDTFGFEGTQIHARLVLTDPGGATQERAFDGISKKGDGGLIKSVVRFTAPANVAGTAFLMIQHSGAPDEQYIYLSRMKTTRRIGGTGEREGSFMGSDFSYADLERKDVRDATYTRLPDDPVGKDACFVLQATPRSTSGSSSGPGSAVYSKVITWVRQKDWMPLRIQMFGRDGQLDKTTFTRRVRVIDGKPVVVESHTENARTHHTTDLVLDDVQFKSDLPDASFTPAALEHG